MEAYIEYLRNKERKAENTIKAYEKDIRVFRDFLEKRNGMSLTECTGSDAAAYLMELGRENKSKATINRKISSLRAFYDFKVNTGEVENNPFDRMKSLKHEARKIDFLEIDEVERLLELPDDSVKGLRDRAIMEFMYGTGARVTELIRVRFSDLNLRMRIVSLRDANDTSRIIPLGSYAYEALRAYIENSYISVTGREPDADDPVFINMRGDAITRQGVWRILKDYADMIGIGERMTPQILRDSFAVHILRNGGDLKTIQELMGFEDLTVGLAYLSCIDIHIKDVFNRTHPRA